MPRPHSAKPVVGVIERSRRAGAPPATIVMAMLELSDELWALHFMLSIPLSEARAILRKECEYEDRKDD